MKKAIITLVVTAVFSTTAFFNAMAATTTEETEPTVAVATATEEFITITNAEPAEKAVKVKLNKDSVKKTTGKKFKLKAKVNQSGYKVKFYSTNKKVAVVNKKGIVTTKNTGTAKIVAKCKGQQDACKVKVVKPEVKGNSIKDSTMRSIAGKVGCQKDRAYSSSSIMCSAYSFAYAYRQVTGKYITPGSVWSSGGCTWTGGTYKYLSSASEMLGTIKKEIDNNKACVGLLSQNGGTHYVTFYSYKGDGTSLSDFTVIDPWDGVIKNASEFGYYSYHVVTID